MTFPLIKLRLTFRALQDMNFPMYAGSALRGIFGKSLRRVSCLAKKEDCAGCAAMSTCPYAAVFENGYIAVSKGEEMMNPYVIEPMTMGQKIIKQGECFTFHHLLFGNAVEKMSYVLLAWSKTGNMGFTKERTQARLIRVHQILADGTEALLYDFETEDAETVPAVPDFSLPDERETTAVRVRLKTPLRIHHRGHPVSQDKLTAHDFLIALIRRQQTLAKQHIPDFPPIDFDDLRPAIDGADLTDANLHWFDWSRYSSRQKTKIALGGIMGEFTLTGDLTKLYPYLITGKYFHVGKSAVLGMGGYDFTALS